MATSKKKAQQTLESNLKDRIETGVEKAKTGGDGNAAILRDARVDALRYYRRELPARFNENSSSYVSSDVYDAVETRKATLLETFTGNVKPVQFAPQDPKFADAMEQATSRVDQVIMDENRGYALFQSVIHDGLMDRNGIVQAFWENEVLHIPYSYEGISQDAATSLIAARQDEVVSWDVTDNDDGSVNLQVTLKTDRSGVRLESVPAEEFGINSDAEDLQSATLTYRRRRIPISRLKSMGVPQDMIDEMVKDRTFSDSSYAPSEDYEKTIRVDDVTLYDASDSDDLKRLIDVYEVYVVLDTDEGKKTYQALWGLSRLLKYELVRRHPFHSFAALMLPHRFWADDFAGTVIPMQKVNTSLMRFALDHGMIAAVPRWLIREGSLVNPKEMENPEMGGLININGDTAGAVVPMPYPNLNPAMFKLMEQTQQEKQMRTGSSDLSGSMLKDVISNQNSADLVSQMATMGQTRTKVMARNFAFFLKGLYEHVYDLIVENQKQASSLQMGDQWVFIDPAQWPIERIARVEFHIGYGEREKEAAQLQQFDTYASAQPGLQRMYGEQQRYNVLTDMMKLTGRYNVDRYLANPQTLPPPQPDPTQQFEAQLKQQELGIKAQQANTAQMAAQAKAEQGAYTTQAKQQTNQASAALKQQQLGLHVAQFQHQATMDAAEVALQHRAHDIHAIAKPVNTQPQK